MTNPSPIVTRARRSPYGAQKLTSVDRFGVWLSQRAIWKRLPNCEKLDVLELGCGYHAKNLVALRSRIRQAVAVDFNVSDEVKRTDYIRVIEAPIDVAIAQLASDSFDVILLVSILEHLWDPSSILRDCHSRLRPGGELFVNVPTWLGKVFLEFSAFRLAMSPKEEMDDHKMYYDKRDLWPLLIRAGFAPSCVSMHYHKFLLNLFAAARKTSGD